MNNMLYAGDFNSEKYWRKEHLSKLPELPDRTSTGIILSMDEMLFPFCSKNDFLITRFRIDQSFADYLRALGFFFRFNQIDFQTASDENDKSIFEIISQNKLKLNYIKNLTGDTLYCDAYAVVPGFDSFCKSFGLKYRGPKINVVRKVNSKVYSLKLSKRLGIGMIGDIVRNHFELISKGRKLLDGGPFLIKDPYGVSGKGNLLVSSPKILESIAKYLNKQESEGQISIFVLEPLLQKKLDFSCAMSIDYDGHVKILCVQQMLNHQFAYSGSCKADGNFIEYLKRKGYFSDMFRIAGELYRDGYTGDVCVDSMLLTSGKIVPVIEINARKSMGFINFHIDKHLSHDQLCGRMSNMNLGFSGDIKFEDILDRMEKQNLLFMPGMREGILPLSCNTLFVNRRLDKTYTPKKLYHGRLYFSVVSERKDYGQDLSLKLKTLLESLSFKIYDKVS